MGLSRPQQKNVRLESLPGSSCDSWTYPVENGPHRSHVKPDKSDQSTPTDGRDRDRGSRSGAAGHGRAGTAGLRVARESRQPPATPGRVAEIPVWSWGEAISDSGEVTSRRSCSEMACQSQRSSIGAGSMGRRPRNCCWRGLRWYPAQPTLFALRCVTPAPTCATSPCSATARPSQAAGLPVIVDESGTGRRRPRRGVFDRRLAATRRWDRDRARDRSQGHDFGVHCQRAKRRWRVAARAHERLRFRFINGCQRNVSRNQNRAARGAGNGSGRAAV